MPSRLEPGLLIAALLLGGCYVEPSFACSDDQSCVINGLQGRCEPSGSCSFPDEACSSGWRYGKNGPPELAGACVVPDVASTNSDSGTEGGGESGSTTGGSASGDTLQSTGPEPSAGSSTGPADSGAESTEGSSTGSPSSCGDGVLDPGEDCDDPNGRNADGCNEDCTISGSLRWSSTLGGTLGLTEDFFGIAVADDGRSFATGALFESNLGSDLWVQQFDPDGGAGWSLSYDGPAHGNDAGRAALVVDDSLYVAGALGMIGSGNDWSVRQFSLEGAEAWSILYGHTQLGDDSPRGVAVDTAGRVFVAGHVQATTSQDVMLRQYLDGGVAGWSTTHDGAAHLTDAARAVTTDASGNVFLGGFETVAGNATDGWVAKVDPAGTIVWTRSHQGAAGLGDLASGVAVDADGALYAVGYETVAVGSSIGWLRKWDSDGNPMWTHTWNGGTDETVVSFLAVAVDTSGHIVVAGSEDTDVKRGIVQKLDADGTLLWSGLFGDPIVGDKRFRAVAIGPDDHIWAAGRMDLGPDQDGFQAWVVRIAP